MIKTETTVAVKTSENSWKIELTRLGQQPFVGEDAGTMNDGEPLLRLNKSEGVWQRMHYIWGKVFSDSSAGKESACNAGDPSLIPGLGRSPGEGIGYPLQCSWAFLVAQTVKNPPAMGETWVWSLGWKDPLKEGTATHCSILAWGTPRDRGAWRAAVPEVTESDMTEQLSTARRCSQEWVWEILKTVNIPTWNSAKKTELTVHNWGLLPAEYFWSHESGWNCPKNIFPEKWAEDWSEWTLTFGGQSNQKSPWKGNR